VLAADNPFFSGGQEEKRAEEEVTPRQEDQKATKEKSGLQVLQPVFSMLSLWQKKLREHLTHVSRDIRENPWSSSFLLFLILSFVYGVIHALGPGHGKSIVFSYFLSRPGRYIHGMLMGNLITFIHVFSAVAIVLGFYLALKTAGLNSFEDARGILEKISYAFLMVLGFFLIMYRVRELKRGTLTNLQEYKTAEADYRHLSIVALATGVVPCPGAALILLFTITLDILIPGLIAMVCIALGMGVTTTLFAMFSIASRNTIFRVTIRKQKVFVLSSTALSLLGACAITMIGSLLFFSRL
jgi:ABC-type nickel/cobalt efflux system permease component RcnA